MVRQLDASKARTLFFWSSALGIAACLAAIRNGQANVIFAALTVNAVASLMQQQWWRASVCLIGGMVVKPLGMVLLLLAPVRYRPIIRPLALSGVLFVASPFLFGAPGYVQSQLREVSLKLGKAAVVTEHRFADINGLFRSAGMAIPESTSLALRFAAGVVVLGLWWWGARRTAEPLRGLLLLSLATSYLMLFNPMNEVNSYVILAPAVGIAAVYFLEVDVHRGTGWLLTFIVLSLGLLPELLWRLSRNFALWWHPLMTIVFLSSMLWRVLQMPRLPSAPEGTRWPSPDSIVAERRQERRGP